MITMRLSNTLEKMDKNVEFTEIDSLAGLNG